jgi:hypothetical protein
VIRFALLACVVACGRRAALDSCTQDLTGEYASGEQHWMILDRGPTLEAYPLFPDVPASDLEIAPRVIELARDRTSVRGNVKRRYMKQAEVCVGKVPITVASCAGDMLEVVLADPTPPLAFTPCQWSRPEPSRRERWVRR